MSVLTTKMTVMMAVLLLAAPILMGSYPLSSETRIYSQAQARIIAATHQAGAQFERFDGEYRFFASQYGCRSNETAYLIIAAYRGRLVQAGFCLADGEGGEIRPASMERVEIFYPADDGSDSETRN